MADLIAPLDEETFVQRHLLAGEPFSSTSAHRAVDLLRDTELGSALDELVRGTQQVLVMGRDGGRRFVSPTDAMRAYDQGDTLYLLDVHCFAPEAARACVPIGIALGVPAYSVGLELFASAGVGPAASFHYDHDINFQVQLAGTKVWSLMDNTHIDQPMRPYHRLHCPAEEALAARLPLPTAWSPGSRVRLDPGATLFVPAGYWHQTEVVEGPSLAVNVVIKPPRWGEAMAAALASRCLHEARFRSHLLGGTGPAADSLQRHARDTWADLKAAAAEVLSTLTVEDAALATASDVYRWAPAASARRMVRGPDGRWTLHCPGVDPGGLRLDPQAVPLVRRLVGLSGEFSCRHLPLLAPELPVGRLYRLAWSLVDLGYLTLSAASRVPGLPG